MHTRSSVSRALITTLVLTLIVAACSGGDDVGTEATTSAPTTATTAGAGETTTTVTTLPVVVGTTLPSVPLAHVVRNAGLADCDWPEEYSEDAAPIVVTVNDIDGRTDLAAAAEGLPAWEIPTSSDDMSGAGMLSFSHRTVRLYGTTLVGGVYLFDDDAAAAAHLEAIGDTFTDAALMGQITVPGSEFVNVESPSPGAFSLTDGVPAEQEYDGFVSVRITSPVDERATYTIDGYAWHTGDTVGFLRAAYPASDGTRGWAATVAAGEMIGRSGGPQFGFFKEPLTTVPDLGLMLEAVLQVGDTFDGDVYDQPLGAQFFSLDGIEFGGPSRLDDVDDPIEWPITAAEMEAVGITNTARADTQWGSAGPLMRVVAHRYTDEAAATAAFEAIASLQGSLDGLYEPGLLRNEELEAVGEDVESFGEPTDPNSGYWEAYWEAVLRHPELIEITQLEVPELGDRASGVLFTGPNPAGPAREKVHLVWQTGSHLQFIRVSAEFGSNPDLLLDELYALAGVLQDRAAVIDGIPSPVGVTGLENYTGYDALVYPKCQPEEATLPADPWLTASAVVVDGDPWVLPITAEGGETIVLSRSQLEALGTDEIAAIEAQRGSLGLIANEVPTDLEIWDETGLIAFAHRVHISDNNANATLVSGAYRYRDADTAAAVFRRPEGNESPFLGWFTSSRAGGLGALNSMMLGTRGNPDDEAEFPSIDGLFPQQLRSNGEIGSMNVLEVPGEDGYRILLVGWINGDMLQFLRARMPLDEPVTLDAFWEVYAAIGQRLPCGNPRRFIDTNDNLFDVLTGEACN